MPSKIQKWFIHQNKRRLKRNFQRIVKNQIKEIDQTSLANASRTYSCQQIHTHTRTYLKTQQAQPPPPTSFHCNENQNAKILLPTTCYIRSIAIMDSIISGGPVNPARTQHWLNDRWPQTRWVFSVTFAAVQQRALS